MAVHYRDAAGKPVLVAVRRRPRPIRGYRADAIRTRRVSIDLGLVETATPIVALHSAAAGRGRRPAGRRRTILVGYGVAREGGPASGGDAARARLSGARPASKILLWAEDADRPAPAPAGDSGGPLFLADGETVVAIVAWTSGAWPRLRRPTPRGR